MKNILSCDWGTSSIRLRFTDIPSLTFSYVESPGHGILHSFELWKQSQLKEEERFSFYLQIIQEQIGLLEQQLNLSLDKIPLVISGMASSSIGMINIPYKEVPFLANGSGLVSKMIGQSSDQRPDILIISGVKTGNDVMRGEETQLAGCTHNPEEERLFIFPGTHSKHIYVNNGQVKDFKTYMTGEYFELLGKKSLLAGSVKESQNFQKIKYQESFQRGVQDSESNLLHASFLVRTNDLFEKLTKEENYFYLSGLLIGAELREIKTAGYSKITLVVNERMKPFYLSALKLLEPEKSNAGFEIIDNGLALVRGQFSILSNMQK